MLEVGSGGERRDFFIRKLLRQPFAKARPELFTRYTRRLAKSSAADKFQMVGALAAEARGFNLQPTFAFSRDAKNPAHRIALLRPQVQQNSPVLRTHLVPKLLERRQPLAVFAHFHAARAEQTIERLSERLDQFHGAPV